MITYLDVLNTYHHKHKMLNRPVYKERYPKDLFYTLNNIKALSYNRSPEAMAIVNQFLNDVYENNSTLSERLDINLCIMTAAENLIKNIFWDKELSWNNKSRELSLAEPEKIENLELWKECKKKLDYTSDLTTLQNDKWLKRNLLSIPSAIEIIKQIYSFGDIFNDTRDTSRIVSNYNSYELYIHYEYNIRTCNRYVLDQILEQPHLINLVYTWDYESMKNNNMEFVEELVSKVFAPKRLLKICQDYEIEFDELMEMY